jgi:membrane-bound lytic murein transglycosylase D
VGKRQLGGGNVPSGNRAGKITRIAGIALIAAVLAIAGSILSIATAGTEITFPRPASIEPNIQFWVDVFSGYGERDFLIHDRDQVWRVYQVLHLPGEGVPSRAETAAINDYLKTKYIGILNHLATGAPPANYEERETAAMFRGEPPSAYAIAAQNLRVQQGMREQFRDGLLRSRYYRPTMERIFRDNGLPPELVSLAEVESGFYSRAKSGAGAVGIWQFTRGTGREFMRITRYHDDRLDPTTETAAAAKLLRSNYLTFGNWPLAITAYNYGTAGMEQASDEYHGDYNRVLQNYSGPHFGFASKNYYAEFLAALQVHEYEDKYFPDLKYAEAPAPPPVRTDFAPRRTNRRVLAVHRVTYRHHHRQTRRRHRVIASSPGKLRAVAMHSRRHSHKLRSAPRRRIRHRSQTLA